MNTLSILYVKNADSSLAPLVECRPGESRTVDVSLAHQNQKRALICFYLLPDAVGLASLDKEQLATAVPAGILDLKKLPENLFDEVRIRMQVLMHHRHQVEVFTWLDEVPLKHARFRLPRDPASWKTGGDRPSAKPPARGRGPAWPALRYATLVVLGAAVAELVAAAVIWLGRH